jgi:hypothetical protein
MGPHATSYGISHFSAWADMRLAVEYGISAWADMLLAMEYHILVHRQTCYQL